MVMIGLTLTLETDAVTDAVRELKAVSLSLAGRHGEAFRALDRRIDRLVGEEGSSDLSACFAFHVLEPCHEVMVPAGELMEVLIEARRLKVLA